MLTSAHPAEIEEEFLSSQLSTDSSKLSLNIMALFLHVPLFNCFCAQSGEKIP